MRNKALLSIRPTIETEDKARATEAFQNDVLRPILKLQNPITLQLLISNKYYDSSIVSASNEKLEEHLAALLQNDKAFRNQLLGMVLGMMTDDEFHLYNENRKEYHKRIVSMQLKRYVDQLLLMEK